jgi:DNA-binding XRE family transcriptional regulator
MTAPDDDDRTHARCYHKACGKYFKQYLASFNTCLFCGIQYNLIEETDMVPAAKVAKEKKKKLPAGMRQAIKWKCTVAEHRAKHGLSQRDVSTALGLSNTFLVGIERGMDIRLTNAVALAEFFGVSIHDLWPERTK